MNRDFSIPKDLYYTDSHTWLLIEGDVGTVGVTDFAQPELGEIVFIELPEKGSEIVQDLAFGTIEAMKTVAELISPISGEVIEKNDSVESEPRQVNSDPYGDGWMIKISIRDPKEVENILTPEDYENFISGE